MSFELNLLTLPRSDKQEQIVEAKMKSHTQRGFWEQQRRKKRKCPRRRGQKRICLSTTRMVMLNGLKLPIYRFSSHKGSEQMSKMYQNIDFQSSV